MVHRNKLIAMVMFGMMTMIPSIADAFAFVQQNSPISSFSFSSLSRNTRRINNNNNNIPTLYGTTDNTSNNNGDGNDETYDSDWFQQRSNEKDIDFIKRITNQSPPSPSPSAPAKKKQVKKGKYQRIEEWDEERKKSNGKELTWEERVQFEGRQYGNQVRQNDILTRNLHTF